MRKETAITLSGFAGAVTIVIFITGWNSLPEMSLALKRVFFPESQKFSASHGGDPYVPNPPAQSTASARVEASAKYEQKRTDYLNPETWISQRIIILLREYHGIKVVFDRYKVTLSKIDGSIWIYREFELSKAIVVEAKSAIEASFFLDKTIMNLWNRNASEPDGQRVHISQMHIVLIGEDENGTKIAVNAEGNS